MILRAVATISVIAQIASAAVAQERVTVGTLRDSKNGALFLADSRGYFKAEGLNVEMIAYASAQPVVQALAAGVTDLGLAALTADAFNLAGKGLIKIVAAQAREKRFYEGSDIVASNGAYRRGLHNAEDLAFRSFGISERSSQSHIQIGQIAAAKGFDLTKVIATPLHSRKAMAEAIAKDRVDATILPAHETRELLVANQGKLIAWYSEIDELQLGALFVSSKMIQTRRATVQKFVRAYLRGVADYAVAFLRHDRYAKRISDAKSREASLAIARYVYPGLPVIKAATTIEEGAYYIDPKGRLDAADIARQIEWYKTQGFLDEGVDARTVLDLSFLD
jgi:NitT/TauT family transport system substrate-binding protein